MGMHRRELIRLLGLSALAPIAGRGGPAPWSRAFERQAPDVDLVLTAATAEVDLLPGDPTRVMRFTAARRGGPPDTVVAGPEPTYLGPTLRLRRGQRVRVRFANRLDEPSIVHWHGLDVPEDADGHPRLTVRGGRSYDYDFTVSNRAGTYWYHPHPHMRTGPQVYRGLAGLLLIVDEEEQALGLPSGASELTLVLQDRQFDGANQLLYPDTGPAVAQGRGRSGMRMGRGQRGMGGMMAMMEMETGVLGDTMLVNGRIRPAMEVEAGWVRIRLLNGSNARIYKLAWTGNRPMQVIGGDGGLLERPIARRALTLAPAQRADVLLDLSDLQSGREIALHSLAFPADEAGHTMMMMAGTGPVLPQGAPLDLMTLRIRGRNTRPFTLPDRLCDLGDLWATVPGAAVRRIPLSFQAMQWLLDGRTFEMEGVADGEAVRPGSTHVWELVNLPNPMGMEMAHPIHLHGRQFRVLSRTGGRAPSLREGIHDGGWTDTVLVLPGETVRIQVTFSTHRGLFLYHCHILEHEDLGMMRNFRIA
jgi:FtsP/CotA-like multicopper oxidase with cupredoxin domain